MKTTFEDQIIFDLFDKWADSLAQGEEEETLEKFQERNGVDRSSPLVMMFAAFLGGINAGLDIFETMNESTKKKK